MTGHQHTLLVVDDDVDARRALQELLQLHDYDVRTAADGADALRQLRAGLRPCLILLDLRMEGMNGWRFREEQVRDPVFRSFAVAVFSGDAHEEAAALELGIRDCLRKPLDLDRLFDVLRVHCADDPSCETAERRSS
jgi:CheY-like chemotaxis protein